MAMVMLNIGILAIVAAFNSGTVALNRASKISTASALADSQMELYRAITYNSIALDATSLGSVDNTYKCDSALGASCPNSTSGEVTATSYPVFRRHRRLRLELHAGRARGPAEHGQMDIELP